MRRLRRRPHQRSQNITSALRLAEVVTTPSGVLLDVEVRWSDEIAAAAEAWSGREVRLGIHWLDGKGAAIDWDGPRSELIDVNWLHLTPQRRRISLTHPPAGGRRIAVELVAEGLAWGEAFGLEPLRLPLPGFGEIRPAPAVGNAVGPEAPNEHPDATRKWLAAGWPEDAPPAEMANYAGADLARFLMSVQLMPGEASRILEVGSNPYFISRLIRRRFPASELRMTNYFGDAGTSITQDVVDEEGHILETFTSELVNTEDEPLPYPDDAFDVVLLCEVIEHLVKDPVFQLAEIARVLQPNGTFIITTPNVARDTNRHRIAQRQGIYDPYSGYGLHGRHNREYTASELFDLLDAAGFIPERYITRAVHGVACPDAQWFAATNDDGGGDYHFIVCSRRPGMHELRRPEWLYR